MWVGPGVLALHQTLRIRDELQDLLPQASFVKNRSIAVLLPCYNEEATIAAVIGSFRRVLPGAVIYVYDNNSSDRTAEIAAAAGAVVRRERYQGKGNVVRRMFADIEADVYILADGDLTYDASAAGRLVDALVSQNVDMVVGVRIGTGRGVSRAATGSATRLFNWVVAHLFGDGLHRHPVGLPRGVAALCQVVSRRRRRASRSRPSCRSTPSTSSSQRSRSRCATASGRRTRTSKLKTYRDGTRILLSILMMYRALQPFRFYGAISLALATVAIGLAAPARRDLLRDRSRAALPHRDSGGQHHAARVPEPDLRHRHRSRQREPARVQAHALPRHSAPPGRSGIEASHDIVR